MCSAKGLHEFEVLLGYHLADNLVDLRIVQALIRGIVASCRGEISAEFQVDLEVLAQFLLRGEEAVVGEKAHIAQAQDI